MKYVVNLKNQIYTKILFYSRCYLTMTQALYDWLGESPLVLREKTETVKYSLWLTIWEDLFSSSTVMMPLTSKLWEDFLLDWNKK